VAKGKNNSFACHSCRGRMRPGALKIATELDQLLPLPLTERRWLSRHDGGDLVFDLMQILKRLVPAALQLAGDQTISGIDGIVLAPCVGGLVARLLERQLELPLRRRYLARLRARRRSRGPSPQSSSVFGARDLLA